MQGSARVELPDGREVRLAYDGRNGQPYTSIGRLLIEAGEIAEARDVARAAEVLAARATASSPASAGARLMQRNRSYVFFKHRRRTSIRAGADRRRRRRPDAAALDRGRPLDLGLRHAVLDRRATLPWRGEAPTPFRRLMIAQDTGSAILGAARADIFFGGGDAAGARAGAIRHRGDFDGAAAARGRAMKEVVGQAARAPPERRLSDEEIALWAEVAKSVARRRGASLPTLAPPPMPPRRPRRPRRRRRRRRAAIAPSRRARRRSRRWSAG